MSQRCGRRQLVLASTLVGGVLMFGCTPRPPQRVPATQYGADPTGHRDSTEAIQRAMADVPDGGAAFIARGSYRVRGTVRVTSSLLAEEGAELVGGESGQPILSCSDTTPSGCTVDGLTVRSGEFPLRHALCQVSSPGPVTFANCVLVGDGVRGVGLDASGATDLVVRSCRFTGLSTAVLLLGSSLRVRLSGNVVENWTGRGIYVVGTAAGASVGLTLEANTVRGHRGGRGPEQPISFQGTQRHLHRDVTIRGNVILGPSRSWLAPAKGTADQLSLTHTDGFVISDNTSLLGGDMGITISDQCRNGVVSGNVCAANDAAGIDIGSRTTRWVDDVSVRGNYCLNNGRNATGRRQPLERAGVVVAQGASTVEVSDNVIGNARGLPTHQRLGACAPPAYGVALERNRYGRHPDGDIGYGIGVPRRAAVRLSTVREEDRAAATAELDEVVRSLRARGLLTS